MRVRLKTLDGRIEISGQSLRFQNLENPFRPVAIPENTKAEVRLLEKSGKVFWALRVNGREQEHLFTNQFLLIQGEGLRIGAQALPERILLNHQKKSVDVVGVIPLEDYVVGVLASEMPLAWPLETLKAQAVAARSYARAVMEERKDKAYHLESSIMDQVFRHVLHEDENDPLIKKAVQAVRETQGQKLFAANHKVLKAFFHSDCGGTTTTAKNVWKSGVNTGTAIDSSCPLNPRAQWKLTLSKEELGRRLRVPNFLSLDLVHLGKERRVQAVRVAQADGINKNIPANEFRQLLGFQELRSSMFTLKDQGHSFVFEGQGYGHGVGLCQWGSRSLGKNGANYKNILKHYYPLARLK
ncbi:MAG: SpoIID/LytB domain-containing protein [Bdellovibrio sp.]|nr:SpoIID/LytB domain-containing protein [Bdellovibrio sp.]